MVSATCNPVRDEILYTAIRKLGGSPTFEATAAALPPDFDLDAMEHSGAIKILNLAPHPAPMIETTPGGTPLALTPTPLILPGTVEEPSAPEAVEEPQRIMNVQQANDLVLAANNALGEARLALRRAQENTKATRAGFANAVTIWQTGLPVYTAERNVRDHLKAQQAARRERIERGGRNATTPPGRSYLDRAAKYGRDNTPEGAARSRMQHGAHRGAFSTASKFQMNTDPRRGPVAKLPSER